MIDLEVVFKALGDLTRLRCLMLMVYENELCVCEFEQALEAVQPKISRHLALLRKTMVVLDRREGQWVYYRLHPELPEWVRMILQGAADGAAQHSLFAADLHRLRTLRSRSVLCGREDL